MLLCFTAYYTKFQSFQCLYQYFHENSSILTKTLGFFRTMLIDRIWVRYEYRAIGIWLISVAEISFLNCKNIASSSYIRNTHPKFQFLWPFLNFYEHYYCYLLTYLPLQWGESIAVQYSALQNTLWFWNVRLKNFVFSAALWQHTLKILHKIKLLLLLEI